MSINTKRKRQSKQILKITPKVEEETSPYLSQSDYSQSQSSFEKCDQSLRSDVISQSVLSFVRLPILSMPTKKIKLNDHLSYSFIPNNYDSYQNHSSRQLFKKDIIQKESSPYSQFIAAFLELKHGQTLFNTYENYKQRFPDFRKESICLYKMKMNQNQCKNQDDKRQQVSNKLQDYQNLILLFSDQHFSTSIKPCKEIQYKCMDFILNYSINEYFGHQMQYQSPSESLFSSPQQSFNIINETKNKKNQQTNNISDLLMSKKQLQCGKSFKNMDSLQINQNKSIKNSSYYQLLLKNIQYINIKEITGIQKIEFSKKTINKLINKFILFLKGDYRLLKYFDFDQTKNQQLSGFKSKEVSSTKSHNQYENTNTNSNFSQNFEITEFNIFELLDEQDRKEFSSQSPNQNMDSSPKNQLKSQSQEDIHIKKSLSIDSYFALTPSDKKLNLKKLNPLKNKLNNTCQLQQQTLKVDLQKEKIKHEHVDQIKQHDEFTKVEYDSIHNTYLQKSISNEQDQKNNKQIKQKRTLFNLSKYLMHLILEFLSKEHLDGLNLIPGFLPLVQNVVERIKKKGQRTEHSQTYYYNHSHYNCLFLHLNTTNVEQIQNQDELFNLHKYIFEITDFNQPYQITLINIIKSVITRLIIKQFKIIRSLIEINQEQNPKKYSNYQNYMVTKLQYFERVYQGIQNLKKGQFLVRF